MFSPSQADVRRFFCSVYAKGLSGQALEAIETIASQWIREHPQYHVELTDVDLALQTMNEVREGKSNPFLHLALHLSISEQCSIDQPQGIRGAVEQLAAQYQDLHAAHHVAMGCLEKMIWQSQQSGRPPDGAAYMECLQRRVSKD